MSLLRRPGPGPLKHDITPANAGWRHIHFQVRALATGESWSFDSAGNELALVNFTGRYLIASPRGEWRIGGRTSVFTGPAHALVLPRHTPFTITAVESGEFAATWAATDRDIAPLLITPDKVKCTLRGGDNVTRQINDLLPPGSPVHRLVLVEVYTPGGNWSSYPPHKHDQHLVAADGALIEANLEEIYYFRTDRPDGAVYQRVYTDPASPGHPIDETMIVRDGDAVLVPAGYHPVTAFPGTTAYGFNVLAGSAQSLANREDPATSWVKTTYKGTDPRLPLY